MEQIVNVATFQSRFSGQIFEKSDGRVPEWLGEGKIHFVQVSHMQSANGIFLFVWQIGDKVHCVAFENALQRRCLASLMN